MMSATRCPTCGSYDRLRRNCVVENCGESHVDESEFSRTHMKVVCSDSWHSQETVHGGDETMSAEQWPDWLTDDSPVDLAVATLARKIFAKLQINERENASLRASNQEMREALETIDAVAHKPDGVEFDDPIAALKQSKTWP